MKKISMLLVGVLLSSNLVFAEDAPTIEYVIPKQAYQKGASFYGWDKMKDLYVVSRDDMVITDVIVNRGRCEVIRYTDNKAEYAKKYPEYLKEKEQSNANNDPAAIYGAFFGAKPEKYIYYVKTKDGNIIEAKDNANADFYNQLSDEGKELYRTPLNFGEKHGYRLPRCDKILEVVIKTLNDEYKFKYN